MKEKKMRSIAKTISWRVVATLTTIAIVFFFSHDWSIALSVGGIEFIAKMIIYYLHERCWNIVKWGHH